jgi:hypothetical protein
LTDLALLEHTHTQGQSSEVQAWSQTWWDPANRRVPGEMFDLDMVAVLDFLVTYIS